LANAATAQQAAQATTSAAAAVFNIVQLAIALPFHGWTV
jgi:hypothetical protein